MGFFWSDRVRWRTWGLRCVLDLACLGLACPSLVSPANAQSPRATNAQSPRAANAQSPRAANAQSQREKTRRASAQSSPWERAQTAREVFEGEPAGTHTRSGFTQVLDQFRAVYHDNPGDPHAADAVYTVAELLREQGRELGDPASLKSAAGQIAFLRQQYPASRAAREASTKPDAMPGAVVPGAVVRAEMKNPATEAKGLPRQHSQGAEPHQGVPEPAVAGLALTEENARRVEAAQGGTPLSTAGSAQRSAGSAQRSAGSAQPSAGAAQPSAGAAADASVSPPGSSAGIAHAASRPDETPVSASSSPAQTKGPVMVTGIRHWSTSTYTRVAIDLGDEVTFGAARVPNPTRIFFDLHGARLGADLVGKSFKVMDDGFLKRIRAAQAGPDMTRIVLDVSDVTDYSAFLLPNPYRLIIDIHGTDLHSTKEQVAGASGARDQPANGALADSGEPAVRQQQAAERVAERTTVPVAADDSLRANAAANSSGLPAMAPTDGGTVVRPPAAGMTAGAENGRTLTARTLPGTHEAHVGEAKHGASPSRTDIGAAMAAGSAPIVRQVPGAVALKAAPANAAEVAAVSEAPGKVEATSTPSTRPIAANVPAVKDVTLGTAGARRRKTRTAADGTATKDLTLSAAAPAKAADKTADGETSMIRALGLGIGRIVIDAGHGGHDSGTLGVDGIEEKDVVLDVALRVGKLLHDRLGAEIIYTRSDDTFIPLETRTAIANKAQADLFLSIHANSSADDTARGVETYYLNFTSDPTALDVAARENAVSGQSIHQLSDLVKKITLKDKIAESREFANDVEASLYAGLAKGNEGLKNRGVKKAPFVVLIGANMPSILAEISFVTNPRDASELRQPEYRERVAESLYAGVARYASGLAGAKAASTLARAGSGQ